MDDKSALVWEYILQAHVHVALELVMDTALAKSPSWESRLKQTRRWDSETPELLPADLLEADGHQMLGARFEHDLSAQIDS
jgi:hypothetical protein